MREFLLWSTMLWERKDCEIDSAIWIDSEISSVSSSLERWFITRSVDAVVGFVVEMLGANWTLFFALPVWVNLSLDWEIRALS